MKFIGIDPGKSGCVAIIDRLNQLEIIPTPTKDKDYDIGAMDKIFEKNCIPPYAFAIIERAQAMPKQGVVSMFEFGRGYGIWLGLLAAYGVPYQIVHSRVWTRKMLDGAPGDGKERAFLVARRLYPGWLPRIKKEHQYADAILLAVYAQRIYGR